MKKTIKGTFLSIVIISSLIIALFNPIIIANADGNSNSPKFKYEVLIDNSIRITECEFYETELVIPKTIDGHEVSVIASDTFSGYGNLRSVTLPDSIKNIETAAFKDCINLSQINIPDCGVIICERAFENTAYTNNANNYSNGLLYIGNHLILADNNYSGVCNIREGTVSIAGSAFGECANLTDVTLPGSVRAIGGNVFKETAFINDDSKYDNGGLYLGEFLINVKKDFAGEFTVKNGTKVITPHAFESCDNITGVVICDGVTTIGTRAFCFCKKLENVAFPDTITRIDDIAFFSCEKLAIVNLPDSITGFGDGVFDCCDSLTSVNINNNSILSSDNGVLFNKDKTTIIQYPIGKADNTYNIPDSVKKIGPYAFRYSENLENVVFPNDLQSIGICAFTDCSNLDNVNIPSSVEVIGEEAFSECRKLNNITIPDKDIHIKSRAFYNTGYYINPVNRQDGVIYIGKHLISVNPEKAGRYVVKEGTITICDSAFRNCADITEVIIPGSTRIIGAYSFYNCASLVSIKIPDGVTSIGKVAFVNCNNLDHPYIPESVRDISAYVIGYNLSPNTNIFTLDDKCVIKGKVGSSIQDYSRRAKVAFSTPGMQLENGMTKPIINYSDSTYKNYNNSKSEILRFCVYVESDYDTDLDGKPDLVKAFVQLPKSAAYGEYKAPIIYEASPYIAGKGYTSISCTREDVISDSQLSNKPAKRISSGKEDTLTHASNANKDDWYFTFDDPESDYESVMYYENLTEYDELLVGGYAVVLSAGLGTYQSEGIECCGTTMERDAFKAVVEWLHGDRKAYTDKESNIEIDADWSNGRIGMVGFSYSAAMAYEVAQTGVNGLETIIAASGPYSWYDYSNSQGLNIYAKQEYDYTSMLSAYCASGFIRDFDPRVKDVMSKNIGYVKLVQNALRGDYGEYWANRDFSNPSNFNTSVLFIHGLNDNNVTTKHFDLVRNKLISNGCDVKTILHQSNHELPWNSEEKSQIMIGNHSSSEWCNLWFAHYLVDADNDILTMPGMMVQSNITGEFSGTDDYDTGKKIRFDSGDSSEQKIDPTNAYVNDNDIYDETFNGSNTDYSACWSKTVDSPITLNGKIPVHLRVKTDFASDIDLPLTVYLVDRCDEPFMAYDPDRTSIHEENTPGSSVTPKSIINWKPSSTNKKIIARGAIDLNNPKAGYEPSTSIKSEEPVKSGEYYDYTVYLNPNYYTVQPGHKLELYIMPFGGLEKYRLYSDMFTEEEMKEMGMHIEDYTRLYRNYLFTIDNGNSYALLPVTRDSGDFDGGISGETTGDGAYDNQTVVVRPPKTKDGFFISLFW